MMKRVLYLGNNLKSKSKYHNAYDTLTINLKFEGYKIINASDKKNQLIRLLDMMYHTIKYGKKVDYVLIDTYSTLAFYFAYFNALISNVYRTPYILILHGGDLPKRLAKSPKMSKKTILKFV